jgi:hypothetical protein
MSNHQVVKADHSVGQRLFNALTQSQLIELIDQLLAVLSPSLQDMALDQLPPDIGQTVRLVLSPPETVREVETRPLETISTAKLQEKWSTLWQQWRSIVNEAGQEEDGAYLTQDAHWEPPYFDEMAFIEDLEQVAANMRPLLSEAFANGLAPQRGFAEALAAAERDISASLPEWIYVESLGLGENLTYCLLEWEWLTLQAEQKDSFAFAQQILTWEERFSLVYLEGNAVLDFLTGLSETEQRAIFDGLTEHQEATPWKDKLSRIYSHWHIFYMHCVEQFAPERYLDSLRATIPQQWENGLPVIEDCLARPDYLTSQEVIEETLAAMLKSLQMSDSWTPESSLLFAKVNQIYGDRDRLSSYKQLLDDYQQTAQGLGQIDLVNSLTLQQLAFDHFFDWATMFKAFGEISLSDFVRQRLFESWRDAIIQRAKPHVFYWGYGSTKSSLTWWLHWLIESIFDKQKGPAWFQQQVAQWLENLSREKAAHSEDRSFLRLLTNDLTEGSGENRPSYPTFHKVVIRPGELSSPDKASRQAYLNQFAPDDLLKQVMDYWQANLHYFVPRPEDASKSDYTQHAHWMAALRELAPESYEVLLDKWRTEHPRRRNLWKAMDNLGLR